MGRACFSPFSQQYKVDLGAALDKLARMWYTWCADNMKIKAILTRGHSDDQGTRGLLNFFWANFESPFLKLHTLELPWVNNKEYRSCIPSGIYRVEMAPSLRYSYALTVKGVPDRTHILLHWGTYAGDRDSGYLTDTEGCILVGFGRGNLEGQKAVLDSRKAVEVLQTLFKDHGFDLDIIHE